MSREIKTGINTSRELMASIFLQALKDLIKGPTPLTKRLAANWLYDTTTKQNLCPTKPCKTETRKDSPSCRAWRKKLPCFKIKAATICSYLDLNQEAIIKKLNQRTTKNNLLDRFYKYKKPS